MALQRFFTSVSPPELTMSIAFVIAMHCCFNEKFPQGKTLSCGM
ncbi:hypothetical protein [Kosakonia sacchari]|nr:hypothetical protein [Kosakonia sacchari]